MASITLTVAGIYYTSPIEVTDGQISAGFTVLQLMRLASRQTELQYLLEDGLLPIEQRSMAVIQNTLPDGTVSRSGTMRAPGTYAIKEQFENERTEAWQYYIERPSKIDVGASTLVSRTVGEKFKAPGSSELLEDGDTVIWRCVSILRSPTGSLI
ncbi:MAG: hypothetical protein ACK58N_16310 [Synechocystis sp.]|jgi:hypothetical protein